MKNFSKKIFVTGFVFFLFFAPVFGVLRAQSNTVTGKEGAVTYCYNGDTNQEVPCDSFNELITAVQNVINYAVGIALSFSVVVIAYAGWLYLTSGDQAAKRTQANGMFVKVAWGIAWCLGAWLVVHLIVTALVNNGSITNILQ